MILKFHVKFCNTLAENSTGQLKTEVRLTRFNNHHHHFRLMIMVDKRIHTIDNKIGVKWYVGLHGKDYKRYKKTQ